MVGAVGVLVNGDVPVVMARADMGAHPVRERTGLAHRLPHRLPRRDVPVDHSPFSDPTSGSCRAPASAPRPSPPSPGPGHDGRHPAAPVPRRSLYKRGRPAASA
ncbi:hypothetical protein ACE1SV_37740 [Streptomyces sennicomposti]